MLYFCMPRSEKCSERAVTFSLRSRSIILSPKKDPTKKYFFILEKTFLKNIFGTFFRENFSKNFRNFEIFIFEIDFPKKKFRFFSISKKYFSEIEKNRKCFLRKVNLKNSKFKISKKFRKFLAKKSHGFFFDRLSKNFHRSVLVEFFLEESSWSIFSKTPKKVTIQLVQQFWPPF